MKGIHILFRKGVGAFVALWLCMNITACQESEDNTLPEEDYSMYYTSNTESLQGWEEALFSSTGAYVMKQRDEAYGYTYMIGLADSPNNCAMILCDLSNRPREICTQGTLISFNDYTEKGVDISVYDSESGITTEHVPCIFPTHLETRTALTRSDEIPIAISLGLKVQALGEFAANVHDYYTLGGSGVKAALSTVSAVAMVLGYTTDGWVNALTTAVSAASDVTMWLKFGGKTLGGAVTFTVGTYLDLYLKYKELYKQQIENLYGDCQVTTGGARTTSQSSAKITLEISDFETLPYTGYQCGIAISKSNLLYPTFNERCHLLDVNSDGTYTIDVEGLEEGQYRYRAFIISSSRVSMWKGDIAGPLILYGEIKELDFKKSDVYIGDVQQTSVDNNGGHNYIFDFTVTAECNLLFEDWGVALYKWDELQETKTVLANNVTGKKTFAFQVNVNDVFMDTEHIPYKPITEYKIVPCKKEKEGMVYDINKAVKVELSYDPISLLTNTTWTGYYNGLFHDWKFGKSERGQNYLGIDGYTYEGGYYVRCYEEFISSYSYDASTQRLQFNPQFPSFAGNFDCCRILTLTKTTLIILREGTTEAWTFERKF
ncbi:hypothetical protein [Bacteroides congonensis]|uniref:hypothetical protein n=1 Tax=Bacteroides congonensis TaxID=1871006 RepID=UPI000A94308D|nr:hypothetical protein [Bacteroides congonensis]